MMETKTLDIFLTQMGKSGPLIVKDLEKALDVGAKVVSDEAVRIVPVDTGDLRNSISYDVGGLTALITAGMPYADTVNQYNPFIHDAVDNKEKEMLSNIGDSFFNAVVDATEDAADG